MTAPGDQHQRQQRQEQTCTVRCALCDWSYEGSLHDGTAGHRAHRAAAHNISAEPWRPPRRHAVATPTNNRAPLVGRTVSIVRERGELTSTEVADALGLAKHPVAVALSHAGRAGLLDNRKLDGENLWTTPDYDGPRAPSKHERIIALLREHGELRTRDLAEALGMTTQRAANFLKQARDIQRARPGRNEQGTLWQLTTSNESSTAISG